jgi:broad specificity phosphatase PhoE
MQIKRSLRVVLACSAIAVSSISSSAYAQEAIFLVQHAERLDNSTDSPLSESGRTRAARLAALLREAGINAVYVTEFQRTAQTAQPLADLLKIPLVKIPAADPGALVSRLQASAPHTRALVVSHSDRLPVLLRHLGYTPEVTVGRDDYDDLFVVVPTDKPGGPTVMRLQY